MVCWLLLLSHMLHAHATFHMQYVVVVVIIIILEIVATILGFVYRDTIVSVCTVRIS